MTTPNPATAPSPSGVTLLPSARPDPRASSQARRSGARLTLAALGLLAASGCIWDPDDSGSGQGPGNTTYGQRSDSGASSGDLRAARYSVTLLWSFAGHRAYEVSDVRQVQVTIQGQVLANGGRYAPSTSGDDGIQLLDFAAGSYAYTVQGLDGAGGVLYEASGTFGVLGNTTLRVDLAPVAGARAYAYVSWTFPQTSLSGARLPASCAEANGVTQVAVSVDDGPAQVFSCDDGFGGSGAPGVLVTSTVGSHTVSIAASTADGFTYFGRRAALPPLVAGAAVASVYSLEWVVGSLPLRWSFANGLSCGRNGVMSIRLDLVDAAGSFVYGRETGVSVPCDYAGVQGTQFPYLAAGTYRVALQGASSSGLLFHSDLYTWPTVTVVAGEFPAVDASTPVISLVAP